MRLHKSEAAFFVFVGVIVAAGLLTLHAYDTMATVTEAETNFQYIRILLFAIGILLTAGLLFGVFFLLPSMRRQVSDAGTLSHLAASLQSRSATLEQAALTDPLTGIQNRRYFDSALREYLKVSGVSTDGTKSA